MHRAGLHNIHSVRIVSGRVIALMVVFVFGLGGMSFAQKKQKLEKNYRDWLERDVAYIIIKEERDTFLKLTTDEAREKFIETFWEIRNPSPGSPTNTYKDEFYQRISFVVARCVVVAGCGLC